MSSGQPDRLKDAAMLALVSVAIAVVALTSLALDPWVRSRPALSRSAAAVRQLELSTLAWLPSGRALRHPDLSHPGVDLRPSPRWPLPPVAPEHLLLDPSAAAVRPRSAGAPKAAEP